MKKLKIILLLFLFFQFISAQERTVFGVVKDTSGLPLMGVNVIVKGTQRGTQTDFDGKYSIKATLNENLVFSFVGMQTNNIPVTKNEINITLQDYDDSNDCIGRETPYYNSKPAKKYVAIYIKGYERKYKKELRIAKRAEKASKRDLKNKDNPKYNFKKQKQSGYFTIYQKDYCDYKKDQIFGDKYHITYSIPRTYSTEYAIAYNKLVFKYLDKKFKKEWQSEIRKDVYGLSHYLKSK